MLHIIRTTVTHRRLLVFALLLGLGWATPSSARAQLSPEATHLPDAYGWTVLYQQSIDGQWDVYRDTGRRDSGWQEVQLTDDPADDTQPQINLVTTEILFVSDRSGGRDLYLMQIDGSGLSRVTHTAAAQERDPAWARDGTQFAYTAQTNGTYQLFRGTLYGPQVQLTDGAGIDKIMPTWSPTGDRIAWVRVEGAARSLWVMGADGSNPQALTGSLPNLQRPAWSPDGNWIAFDYDHDGDGYNEVVALHLPTATTTVLVNSSYSVPDDPFAILIDDWVGAWTPHGATLAVARVGWSTDSTQASPKFDSVLIENAALPGQNIPYYFNLQSGIRIPTSYGYTDLTPPIARLLPQSWARWPQDVLAAVAFDPHNPSLWSTRLEVERRFDDGNWEEFSIWNPAATTADQNPQAITDYQLDKGPRYPLRYGFNRNEHPKRLAVRAQTTDGVGNVSPWSTPPLSVQLYDWQLQGVALDLRGIPLAHTTLTLPRTPLAPVVSDADGHYVAYYRENVPEDLSLGAPIPLFLDRQRVHVPPTADALINEGFEQGWASWEKIGAAQSITTFATLVTNTVYAGAQSLVLGSEACRGLCLVSRFGGNNPEDRLTGFWADPTGNGHLILSNRLYIRHLFFPRNSDRFELTELRQQNGTVIIQDSYSTMASDGTIHVVWHEKSSNGLTSDFFDNGIWYRVRSNTGEWRAPERVAERGSIPQVAIGADGSIYVVSTYITSEVNVSPRRLSNIWKRTPGRGWQLAYDNIRCPNCDSVSWLSNLTLTVDHAGVPQLAATDGHLVFYASGQDGFARWTIHTPNHTWTRPNDPTEPYNDNFMEYRPAHSFVDGASDLHLLSAFEPSGGYTQRSSDGVWTRPEQVISQPNSGFATDAAGGFYLAGADPQAPMMRYYHPTWGWEDEVPMPEGAPNRLALTPDGLVYAWQDGLWTSRLTTSTTTGGVSRRITLPADQHAPTLAFVYQMDTSDTLGRNHLTAQIDDGLRMTTLLTATGRTPWTVAWADLSAWAGQSVTLTLQLHQAADAPLTRVALDQVVVAPWTTPHMAAVTQPTDDSRAPIRITGINFMPGAEVYWDDARATGVTWIDAQTLEALPPGGLQTGFHTVRVVNPGGAGTHLPNAVHLGRRLNLPLIANLP